MRATIAIATIIIGLSQPGCSAEVLCGEGTRSLEGACVPACSAGHRWAEEIGECLEICSEGTVYNEESQMCEPALICGAGTHVQGHECVPDSNIECGSGTSFDQETGRCVPDCVDGTHRDDETGACMPDSAECITGQVWDAEADDCVDVADFCGDGTTWLASEQTCVPDELLLDADITEGDGENDPTYGGAEAPERFELPEHGGSLTIGGAISAATDKDDDGVPDPDHDYFEFEVDQPTLLRISADGVGGASSGFMVVSLEEGNSYRRYGIGTTTDGSLRDVFLPEAGSYALVASDALNFVTAAPGPFFGGGGLGYFIVIEQLVLPRAAPLTFDGEDELTASGRWPREPGEAASMLAFYELDLTIAADRPGTLLRLGLMADDPTVEPLLLVQNADTGRLIRTVEQPVRQAFAEPITLTFVADYIYWFGVSAVDHEVKVEDLQLRAVADPPTPTSINQPSWVPENGELPLTYFGFHATAGEVVTVHTTTTTGATSFEVFDDQLETTYGWFGGRDSSPRYDGSIRFYCQRDGLYILTALDLTGGVGALPEPSLIPAHRFSITAEVRRQTPFEVGALREPWVTAEPEEVTPQHWERFVLVEPEAGQSLLFEVIPVDGFTPSVSLYEVGTEGPLRASAYVDALFPRRSREGQPMLIGVADAAFAAGSFHLSIEPVDILDLGVLSSARIIEIEGLTVPDQGRRFVTYTPQTPGLVSFEVSPRAELDLSLTALGANLEEFAYVDDAEVSGVEVIELLVVGDEPAFAEITVVGPDLPIDGTTSVDLSLRLDPFVAEDEPNDDFGAAQPTTTLPATLAGSLEGPDEDWYAVTVEAAATIEVETFGLEGGRESVDTRVVLLDVDGFSQLAEDDDSGEGSYSRLSYTTDAPGTYYLVVHASGDEALGRYFLSVDATML